MTTTPTDDAGATHTPDEVDGMMQRLAQVVLELGTVDYGGLISQDETPATAQVRVTTLVNACGMLGSLAIAAQVPCMDFFDGLVAATLAGSETAQPGSGEA